MASKRCGSRLSRFLADGLMPYSGLFAFPSWSRSPGTATSS